MFHDKRITKCEKLGELWKAANNLLKKAPRRISLPRSCEKISRLLNYDDDTVHHRLSLRSAAMLIHGASLVHKKQTDNLLMDLLKLDKQMRTCERLRREPTETEVAPSTSYPEQRPSSPILPGPSHTQHARLTQRHGDMQDVVQQPLLPLDTSQKRSTRPSIEQEDPEEFRPISPILPAPKPLKLPEKLQPTSEYARATRRHGDIQEPIMLHPSVPSDTSTQQFIEQEDVALSVPVLEELRPVSPILPAPLYKKPKLQLVSIESAEKTIDKQRDSVLDAEEPRPVSPILPCPPCKKPKQRQPAAIYRSKTPQLYRDMQDTVQHTRSPQDPSPQMKIQQFTEQPETPDQDSVRRSSLKRTRYSTDSVQRTEILKPLELNEDSPRRILRSTIERPTLSDVPTIPGNGTQTTQASRESGDESSRKKRDSQTIMGTSETSQTPFDRTLPLAAITLYESYEARMPSLIIYTSVNKDTVETVPI